MFNKSFFVFALSLISICAFSAHLTHRNIHDIAQSFASPDTNELYLPGRNFTEEISLGFKNLTADLLWFRLINYFGKQYISTKNYQWLSHMCGLINDLDPGAIHVFEFCATMLSWELKNPKESNRVLTNAIIQHPENWRFFYMRGFNNWYFLEQQNLALRDFERASKSPGAPPFLASLAARLMVNEGSVGTAIEFLQQTLERTNDPRAREAITEKLYAGYLARDLDFLQEGYRRYREQYNESPSSIADLVSRKVITRLPVEPFGGEYQLNSAGEVITTSGKKPLRFFGKTAKTGIVKGEFGASQ